MKKEDKTPINKQKVAQDSLTEATNWLTEYFGSQEIVYDYKTDSLKQNGDVLDPKIMMTQLRLASYARGNSEIKKLMGDLLTMWKHQQQFKVVDSYRDNIKYKGSDDHYITDWVKAVTGDRKALDIAVMKHFIWQIKRKLFKMPVEHHMMPILYGKSGGGKSVAVNKLIESLNDLCLSTSMSVFEDRFGKRQFTRNYIMFFDELNGANGTDVNKLKQVITAPVMEWRVMHSEGVASAPQNCTFIGCTNDPVSERIKDPTSARRFWQLNCADQLDWQAINNIDYTALWQSVDENQPCPILGFIDEIRKVQEEQVRHKDVIEQWLVTNCDNEVKDISVSHLPTSKQLYDNFVKFCEWQKIATHPGFLSFTRALPVKMNQQGWSDVFQHTANGTVWPLRIKE